MSDKLQIPACFRANVVALKPLTQAAELDIEYTNGWRETVTVKAGERFRMPFNGKLVGYRTV